LAIRVRRSAIGWEYRQTGVRRLGENARPYYTGPRGSTRVLERNAEEIGTWRNSPPDQDRVGLTRTNKAIDLRAKPGYVKSGGLLFWSAASDHDRRCRALCCGRDMEIIQDFHRATDAD
jgi:hypothetical protein